VSLICGVLLIKPQGIRRFGHLYIDIKRLDSHAIPGLDGFTVFGQQDEAIGMAHGCEDPRALLHPL